jgi:ParB family chromosome partitioning protein
LLVLAFAGSNVRVDSGAGGMHYGGSRFGRHAARLFTEDGRLSFDMDTVRVAARGALIDVLSCRRGMSNSGVVSRVAGEAIGADSFLPNMGTEDFLICLSRQSLEAVAKDVGIQPRARVRETRSALVEHFEGDAVLVHLAALFPPDPQDIAALLRHGDHGDVGDDETAADPVESDSNVDSADDIEAPVDLNDEGAGTLDDHESAYGIAAE